MKLEEGKWEEIGKVDGIREGEGRDVRGSMSSGSRRRLKYGKEGRGSRVRKG